MNRSERRRQQKLNQYYAGKIRKLQDEIYRSGIVLPNQKKSFIQKIKDMFKRD